MNRMIVMIGLASAACGGGKTGGPATPQTTPGDPSQGSAATGSGGSAEELTGVGVAIRATPVDATVTIDDVVMGKASELDPVVALAPGLHTLVLAKPGLNSYRVEFSVTDRVEMFTIKLEPASATKQ